MTNTGNEPCACKPGTHAEGWQEARSEACLEREREEWRQMLTRYAEREEEA